MNTIWTSKINSDEITVTAEELPLDANTTKTEYFVDFWKNGKDNTWTEVFKNEADAIEFAKAVTAEIAEA